MRYVSAWVTLAVCGAFACGSDDVMVVDDGGGTVDGSATLDGASGRDGGTTRDGGRRADAGDPCPGQRELEVVYRHFVTDEPVVECGLTEIAMTDHYALAGDDGVARICTDETSVVEVISSTCDTRDRYDRLSLGATDALRAAGHRYVVRTYSNATMVALEAAGVASPNAGEMLVEVQVIDAATGGPVEGATVATAATNAGLFIRQSDGTVSPGSVIGPGGAVLAASVSIDPPPVFTVTPPSGSSYTCSGEPGIVSTGVGAAVAGVLFVCAR